jgi:hypothetical protein
MWQIDHLQFDHAPTLAWVQRTQDRIRGGKSTHTITQPSFMGF